MQTVGLIVLVWTVTAFGIGMILGKFMRKGNHPLEKPRDLVEAQNLIEPQSRQSAKLNPRRVFS